MSVCLSTWNLVPDGWPTMKFLYWGFLSNSVKKIQVLLKLDKNKRKALYLYTHVDFILLRLLTLPLFLLLLWLVMIPLIFWLARLPVFYSLLWLHEHFRSVPLRRHFLSCCCCCCCGGGGSENGEDLTLPPTKRQIYCAGKLLTCINI